jgi:Tol biopolymer transport system component/C-terminal processing protease CtpA/Prc
MRFRHFASLTTLLALLVSTFPSGVRAQDGPASLPSFAEPGISPDHAEIAFVSGGDVWSVPATGGTARLLAATGGYADRPLFSPDGKRLAFVSTRPGAGGVYVVNLADGAVLRLTHDDVTPDLDAWSSDGRFVYFATPVHNLAYQSDIYRVDVEGGTSMPVLHEAFVNSMDAVPSPDGADLVYVRNGFVQWWRRGHSHMDQSEITVEHLADKHFETITAGEAKDRWPMWAPDGRTLYYVSDRSGGDELWERAGNSTRQLTHLGAGRVLFPSLSRDGRTIAFERAQRLWTYDTSSGSAHELAIELRGTPNLTVPAHVTLTARFSALSLAPDDKKIAFVGRGRIFAASSADGGNAQAVPSSRGAAADLPVWSKDSRTIAYVIDRGSEQAIATYAFPDGTEKVLTPPGHHDDYPHWSPDGTSIAFVRDGTELRIYDLATASERVLARGFMDRRPFGDPGDIAFSPAGDWIAYVDQDKGGFENVRVVPVAGGESRAVTFFPNAGSGTLAWAPDGTRLFFVTGQRTEPGDVAQIDLVPRAPKFREDNFRRLFEQPKPELPTRSLPTPVPSAAPRPSASPAPKEKKKTTTIEFAGIGERVSILQTGLDVARVSVTPDGKTLVLVADAANETNLYSFSIDDTSDEPQVAKQLTNSLGRKGDVAISSDGRTAYYTDSGRIFSADLTGKGARPLGVAAELDVDFNRDKPLVFDQMWSNLDRWYADPTFHGANWGALHGRYAPYAVGARSPAEYYRVLSLMIGELNSSHTGIFGQGGGGGPYTGRLGVDWDPAAYQRDGKLRVANLVPLGPLAVAGHVAAGDELVSVNGVALAQHVDLDEVLANSIGKRTELRFAPAGGETARTVVVQPVDRSSEQRLRYLAWVAGRRAYVERISGGRVGYVHLLDMGQESLKKFFLDLDVQNRARQAVIVDVRNNEGGFVDPYAIDVLTRRGYATFRSRFGYDASERTALGQRVLERPTALVVNEHSLSDAENFTEAYRALHAGPVVGVPTAGWIIFTSGMSLADGSFLRLPSTLVFAHDGVDMELHPRPVDVRVENPPGAAERGDDPQLAAAVRELEKKLGR